MHNPESEFHRRSIATDRAQRKKLGIIGMYFCGIFFLLFVAVSVTLLTIGNIGVGTFLQMLLVIGGFTACNFYLLGFSEYQRGTQPVTEREVAKQRQEERAKLFREAQGELPSSLRTWRIVVESLLGAVLTLLGIIALVFWFPRHELVLLIYAIGFLFCGLALLWLALYLKPRSAKQRARWSAQELAYRIDSGEFTEGTIKEDE